MYAFPRQPYGRPWSLRLSGSGWSWASLAHGSCSRWPYIDPAIGGLFTIDTRALVTMLAYLAYGVLLHEAARRRVLIDRLPVLSATLDVLFAVVLAIFTEGHTSPAFAFFAFAIIAASCRAGFRTTLAVTLSSMLLYFMLLTFLARETRDLYLMRPVYLAVTGYLIGFLAQQRAKLQAQAAQRHQIARFLHDGYVQGLAGINLRLETARELLRRQQPDQAGLELRDLQTEVTREFDAVRAYIRDLAEVPSSASARSFAGGSEPRFALRVQLEASGLVVENVLQVLLEAARSTRSHANARSAAIEAAADAPHPHHGAVNAIRSMRVAPEVEIEGLDVPEFGLPGYPEDAQAALAQEVA